MLTDWVGVYTVDRKGRPYFSERTDLVDRAEIDDARLRNFVWHLAATRHPDFAHLEPKRDGDDYDCPSCRGTGQLPPPFGGRGKLICSCGGLGWLPAGYVDPANPMEIRGSA